MRGLLLLLLLLLLASCTRYGLALDVDSSAVDGEFALEAAIYADDGDGCAAERFRARPALTLLTRAPLPLQSVDVPRLGKKLIVVEAVRVAADGDVVGRGCAEAGDVDGEEVVAVSVLPTHRFVEVAPETLVIAADDEIPGVHEAVALVDGADVVVRARVLAADGEEVEAGEVVSGDEGRVTFAPSPASLPAGPARVEFTVENPSVDEDAVFPAFSVPLIESVAFPVEDVRPFVVGGEARYAGVSENGRALASARVDGSDARVLATATTAAVLVGVASSADTDGFIAILDGQPALVTTDGLIARGPDITDGGADDLTAARFVAAGACPLDGGGPNELPGVIVGKDRQILLDYDGESVSAVELDDVLVRVAGSACAVDEEGEAHRVLLLIGAGAIAALDLGAGAASVDDVRVAPQVTAGLEDSVGFVARDDGLILSAEADGGEVLVRLRRLQGSAFVDAGVAPVRLPAAPAFLAAGSFFGGTTDLVALLDIGTLARPDLAALFGVGTASGAEVAAGILAEACSPSLRCADALTVDVDGDGFLEILSSSPGAGLLVRFR